MWLIALSLHLVCNDSFWMLVHSYQAPSSEQTRPQYNNQQQQPPRQARAVYNAGNEGNVKESE